MTADFVSVLRCESGLAAKRWVLDRHGGQPRLVNYSAGKWFKVETVEICGIRELSALLTRLEHDTRALVIRGELLPGVDPRRVRRLKHRRGNAAPAFGEPAAGRCWVLIDFDKVPVPPHIDIVDDPVGAVEYLVGLLPDEFRDVSYHWQLSSSAGMGDPGVLSGHLWFFLDRPVTEFELKRWGAMIDAPVDTHLFGTVQPHYTAAPIFDVGVRDPLVRRSGLRVGLQDAVRLIIPDPAPRHHASSGSTGGDDGLRAAAGFEAKLALLGDGPGLAGFHGPLLTAVWAYVREHGVGGTDAEALKVRLREAINTATKRPDRDQDIARYRSDRFLDDLITGAIHKLQNASAEPPYFPAEPLPIDEAVKLMREAIGGFFDDVLAGDQPRVGVRTSAGAGKTQAVIDALAVRPAIRDMAVEVYAPTHKLTREWATRLNEEGPDLRVQMIYGRGYIDDAGSLCERRDAADELARAGVPIYESLCERQAEALDTEALNRAGVVVDGPVVVERCPHFETCRYLAQFADKRPAVRLMAHAYLPVPRGRLLPKPDLVIVDEMFWRESIAHRSMGLDRLTASRPGRQFGKVSGGAVHAAIELADFGKLLHDSLLTGQPLLAELRGKGITSDRVAELLQAERGTLDAIPVSPGMSDDAIHAALAGLKRRETFDRMRLLTILRDEIATGRDSAHGIELRRDMPMPDGERQDRVFMHWRRALSRLSGVPVLLIDADLAHSVVEQVVPGITKVVEIAVERRATVEQVSNTRCSKRRLVGTAAAADRRRAARHMDEVRDLIRVEAAGGRRVLVISYKPVRCLLTGEADDDKLPPSAPLKDSQLAVDITHFGGIRGQDRWRDYGTVIVVGRHQPPVLEIEALGRALYYDRAEPLRFVQPDAGGLLMLASQRRGYRLRGGLADVEVEVHPDPDIQALLEQLREAEMVQAVDRLRLIHNGTPKRVIVVSNLPLDLTVDELRPWREVMPTRLCMVAGSADAVPLSTRELARCFPLVWRSREAARADFRRRGLNTAEALIEYILEVRPYLMQAEYRRPGEPGRAVRALVSGLPELARETLESVVGPMSSFRLVEAGQSPVAPEPVRPEPVAVAPDEPEVERPAAAMVFCSGIVPPELRAWSRERRRAACVSQGEVARRIGVSRPQLANAEAGRFGLSTETAARFVSTVAGLPERQAGLRF